MGLGGPCILSNSICSNFNTSWDWDFLVSIFYSLWDWGSSLSGTNDAKINDPDKQNFLSITKHQNGC